MHKFIIVGLFLTFNFLVEGQNQKTKISEDSIINKWTKASINLRTKPNFFTSKIWAYWQQEMRKGNKLNNQAAKQIQENYRKIEYSATAIFLFDKNKHYLVTARHCLIDTGAFFSNSVFDRFFLGDNGSFFLNSSNTAIDTMPDVKYFDGHTGGKSPKYILSDEEEDVGIIALDDIPIMGRQFVAMLYDKGYRPVELSDIDSKQNLIKDQPIFAVGFPKEISELEKYRKNIDSSINHWQSPYVTVPVISRGRIKNVYRDSFTGNIFSYHGNSGWPIISNNKLVGLNSAIARPRKDLKTQFLNYYIDETAYFSRASNIINQLIILETRFPPNDNPYVVDKDYRQHLHGVISGGLVTVSQK